MNHHVWHRDLALKFLIFILCLGLTGCDTTGRHSRKEEAADRAAIQKVMEARTDIRQVISHVPQNDAELAAANHDPGVMIFSVREYVKRLRSIALKNCPEDFQTAFVKYVEAWNARSAANPGLCLLLSGNSGMHVENDPEIAGLTESTWRDLQVVVSRYMTSETKSF